MTARVPAAERRALLVEAAFRVVAGQGVQAASTRVICQEAGMPQSAFHYCFRSKREMLQELITVTVQGMAGVAAEGVLGGPDGPADITTLISRMFDSLWEESRTRPERQLALYELTTTALRDPELADLAESLYRAYSTEMADLIAAIETRADVAWTVPRPVLARMIVSAFDGLVLGWLADRDDAAVAAALAGYASTFATLSTPRQPPPAGSPAG